jgi:maltose O-acetyltransferase
MNDLWQPTKAPAQSAELTSRVSKVQQVFFEEIQQFHPRLVLLNILLALLPIYVGNRLRAYCLRMAKFDVGYGTIVCGMPRISGHKDLYRRLKIGHHCMINIDCFLDLGADITIGDRVSIGHQVMILTTSHKIGTADCRAAELTATPVTIEDGAWLGTRCTILPGVRIGAGAIVAAGATVNRDVPPNTLVAGVPARIMKTLN